MLLKFILFLLLPSISMAQNAKPLIVTDNASTTCNATRMIVSSGSLSCSGSVATVTTNGGSGGGSPGGSTTQVQYNSSGLFAGNSGFVYDGTNVGIGSPNPGQLLDVSGTVRALNFIGTNGGAVTSCSANQVPYYSSAGDLLGCNSNITSNGTNIGIGTINPANILSVGGGVGIGTAYSTIAAPNNSLIVQGNIGIQNSNPLGALIIGANAITATVAGNMVLSGITVSNAGFYGGQAVGSILNLTATQAVGVGAEGISLNVGSNGAVKAMTIKDVLGTSANIGIGSTVPGTALDVQGTIRATNMLIGTQPVCQQNGTNCPTAGSGTVNSGTTSQAAYYASSTTAVSGTSALTFTGSGSGSNVGVGSITPGSLLDVQGTVRDLGEAVNGNLGIGSASPGFALDVNGGGRFTGSGNTLLNTTSGNVGIGTSVPNNALVIKGSYAQQWGVNIPVITSCGTSPSVKGTDNSFSITVGSVSATGCTATFGGTYSDATCSFSSQTALTSPSYTVSSTAFVLTVATGLIGDILNVTCGFKN